MFQSVFLVLLVVCIGLNFSEFSLGTGTAQFRRFQLSYLSVYYVVMFADWCQGPYVYALYESYGFGIQDIATLFIAGFLSSGVFGTIAGSMADKYGRRFMAVMYGVLYSLSCITKLYNDYNILMFGRVLGGIATSLLFSVFEAWMVNEHNKRSFEAPWMSQTFSYATLGNGIVAIVAGVLAGGVADTYGFVAPFMLSLVFLVLSIFLILGQWSENYGDSRADTFSTFGNAWKSMVSDRRILILGAIQSLFEGSMYTFVFMWTPAISAAEEAGGVSSKPPFGLIFSTFMVCVMIGSALFRSLIKVMSFEALAAHMFVVAACALAVPIVFPTSSVMILAGFCVFETCCGIFWPVFGTLRSQYIDESCRSAIMNFFRVPLNLMVVGILIKVGSMAQSQVFSLCVAGLATAAGLQLWFNSIARK